MNDHEEYQNDTQFKFWTDLILAILENKLLSPVFLQRALFLAIDKFEKDEKSPIEIPVEQVHLALSHVMAVESIEEARDEPILEVPMI